MSKANGEHPPDRVGEVQARFSCNLHFTESKLLFQQMFTVSASVGSLTTGRRAKTGYRGQQYFIKENYNGRSFSNDKMRSEVKARIETLRRQLHEHNYNYYVLSQPTISDFEFDALMRQLAELEKQYPEFYDPNSPTMRVGSDINKNFVQVQHRYPMLSLQNTYTEGEISDFFNRVKRSLNEECEIVCELKFDGTSISLIYENGRLLRAITRGDGKQGDDVTANVRTIRNIPLVLKGDKIPAYVEVRGEILMPWSVFEELNREREAQEEPLFANPRNAASGTLKMQDPKAVASRRLESYIYYLMGEELPSGSHFENMEIARGWGLHVSPTMKKCRSLEEVLQFLSFWEVERKNLPVATDGVVLKVDSLSQQRNLGSTSKFPVPLPTSLMPRRPSRAWSRLPTRWDAPGQSLRGQPRTGPVVGHNRKAGLAYNEDAIRTLDLHIGDMVYVEKEEIIPKITGVDSLRAPGGEGRVCHQLSRLRHAAVAERG